MNITYKGLQIELPYEILQVENLHLVYEVNEHAELMLKGLITQEQVEICLHQDIKHKSIRVTQLKEDESNILFVGKILEVKIDYRGKVAILTIKAKSHSYELDVKRYKRAFSDTGNTYEQIIRKILEKYPKKNFIDYATAGRVRKDLLVQYEETDWEFIKRLATHFQTVLVVDAQTEYARMSLGVPKKSQEIVLDDNYYKIKANFEQFNSIQALNEKVLMEQDFIGWEVESYEYIPLGMEVRYQNQKVHVTRLELVVYKEELIYKYHLNFIKGIKTSYQINKKLQGISLEAIVKARRNNEVKVQFCINENKNSVGNKWFPFTREVGNWYCIPVEGAKVHVEILSGDEKDAVITHALQSMSPDAKYASKTTESSNKYYSTIDGQELLMNKEQVQISQDEQEGISLNLQKDGHITITGKNINIESSGNIELGLKNPPPNTDKYLKPISISLSAKNQITLTKNDTDGVNPNHSIQLNEENHMKGMIKLGEEVQKSYNVSIPTSGYKSVGASVNYIMTDTGDKKKRPKKEFDTRGKNFIVKPGDEASEYLSMIAFEANKIVEERMLEILAENYGVGIMYNAPMHNTVLMKYYKEYIDRLKASNIDLSLVVGGIDLVYKVSSVVENSKWAMGDPWMFCGSIIANGLKEVFEPSLGGISDLEKLHKVYSEKEIRILDAQLTYMMQSEYKYLVEKDWFNIDGNIGIGIQKRYIEEITKEIQSIKKEKIGVPIGYSGITEKNIKDRVEKKLQNIIQMNKNYKESKKKLEKELEKIKNSI